MGPSGFTLLEQKLKIGGSTREQQFRMITLVLNSSFHLETHDFTWGAQTSWLPALSLHSLPLILFLPYGQAVLRGSLALLWSCVKWWIEGPVPQSIVSGMPVSWKQRPSLQLELRASMATTHDKSPLWAQSVPPITQPIVPSGPHVSPGGKEGLGNWSKNDAPLSTAVAESMSLPLTADPGGPSLPFTWGG